MDLSSHFGKPEPSYAFQLDQYERDVWNNVMLNRKQSAQAAWEYYRANRHYGAEFTPSEEYPMAWINRDCRVNRTNLDEYVFYKCDMRAGIFNGMSLKNSKFYSCKISDWYYQSHFVGTNLEGAIFRECQIDSPAMHFANLRNVVMDKTYFIQAYRDDYMYCTDLRGANLSTMHSGNDERLENLMRRTLASAVIDETTQLPKYIPERSTLLWDNEYVPGKRALLLLSTYNGWLRDHNVQPQDDPFFSLKRFMNETQAASLVEQMQAIAVEGQDFGIVMSRLLELAMRMGLHSPEPEAAPSGSVQQTPPASIVNIQPVQVDNPADSIDALLNAIGATRADIRQDVNLSGEGGFSERRFIGKADFLSAFQAKGVSRERAEAWMQLLETAYADAGKISTAAKVKVELPFPPKPLGGDTSTSTAPTAEWTIPQNRLRWQINPLRLEIDESVLKKLVAGYEAHRQRGGRSGQGG